ncbi:hypothetical protein JCM9957A_37040 [Kineosporia succinea]
MTMTTAAPRPLAPAVHALERGDWRTVLGPRSPLSGGDRTILHLTHCLRLVADAMRLQTLGQAVAAQARLNEAVPPFVAANGRRAIGPEPRPGRVAEHLLWRTGRVLEREHDELAALRRAGGALAKGQPELVCACVEHLTWVEFDPFSVRPGPDEARRLGLDDPAALERFGSGNRIDLCDRASDLRQLAGVWTGPVSGRTWQRAGGYRVLRAEALTLLADEPPSRASSLPVPPRLGRLRAWEYARQWSRDSDPAEVA